MIILHALVGIIAFAGAGVMSISFAGHLNQLSKVQKWSIIITATTIGITAVLGLYSSMGIIGAVVSLILLAGFEYFCFFKEPKQDHEYSH
ncbi:hypothetical protein [Fructilactobacillus florum]|uniref:Uncharacterized protein n=1 Tax=Fructilactobacillus florum DSM 22689 = JCM 16035 TaxID=1423745 RepID=A0A0R2CLI5_9LACO|nr:hypothetical protein [Fructilactobacillus florum]KRM92493.1 hypothetical protein FC87_GL000105 [Fructilactobacillus florum DSM 22689 = JCM 16035]